MTAFIKFDTSFVIPLRPDATYDIVVLIIKRPLMSKWVNSTKFWFLRLPAQYHHHHQKLQQALSNTTGKIIKHFLQRLEKEVLKVYKA